MGSKHIGGWHLKDYPAGVMIHLPMHSDPSKTIEAREVSELIVMPPHTGGTMVNTKTHGLEFVCKLSMKEVISRFKALKNVSKVKETKSKGTKGVAIAFDDTPTIRAKGKALAIALD